MYVLKLKLDVYQKSFVCYQCKTQPSKKTFLILESCPSPKSDCFMYVSHRKDHHNVHINLSFSRLESHHPFPRSTSWESHRVKLQRRTHCEQSNEHNVSNNAQCMMIEKIQVTHHDAFHADERIVAHFLFTVRTPENRVIPSVGI